LLFFTVFRVKNNFGRPGEDATGSSPGMNDLGRHGLDIFRARLWKAGGEF
jgi:hypothetical protein